VVAATTRVLAGRGRDLGHISVAINQEMGPAEMRCQPEGAAEPLGEQAFATIRFFGLRIAAGLFSVSRFMNSKRRVLIKQQRAP
jgi:hypothetical protein